MREGKREPGDIILDRVMPNATPEEREAARENLCRLARFLFRVHERLLHEKDESAIRANAESTLESEHSPTNV